MAISERDIASGHAPRLAGGQSAITAGPTQPLQLRRGRLTAWRASSARYKDGSEDRPRKPRFQAEPSAKDRSPGFGFVLALVLSTVVWLMFLAGLTTLLVRALMASPVEAAADAPSPRSSAPDWSSSLTPLSLCQRFGGEPITGPTSVWNARETISPSCTVIVVAVVDYTSGELTILDVRLDAPLWLLVDLAEDHPDIVGGASDSTAASNSSAGTLATRRARTS